MVLGGVAWVEPKITTKISLAPPQFYSVSLPLCFLALGSE